MLVCCGGSFAHFALNASRDCPAQQEAACFCWPGRVVAVVLQKFPSFGALGCFVEVPLGLFSCAVKLQRAGALLLAAP